MEINKDIDKLQLDYDAFYGGPYIHGGVVNHFCDEDYKRGDDIVTRLMEANIDKVYMYTNTKGVIFHYRFIVLLSLRKLYRHAWQGNELKIIKKHNLDDTFEYFKSLGEQPKRNYHRNETYNAMGQFIAHCLVIIPSVHLTLVSCYSKRQHGMFRNCLRDALLDITTAEQRRNDNEERATIRMKDGNIRRYFRQSHVEHKPCNKDPLLRRRNAIIKHFNTKIKEQNHGLNFFFGINIISY